MNEYRRTKRKNKGQVSLVVLLVAAVITTLGLSLSKKTVLETKIDIDDELQKQAFDTAESGIEYFLGTGTTTSSGKSIYQSVDGKTRADITIQSIDNDSEIDFNELVSPGGYQYFWLVGHRGNGEIDYATYYDGNGVDVCVGGSYDKLVAVNYFYRNGVNYNVKRYMLDFTGSPGGCLAVALESGMTQLLLTASPVWTGSSPNSVNIKLRGGSNFPSQGSEITAVGQAGDLGGNVVKSRVKTLDRYQMLPFMLEPISAAGSIGN